MARSSRATVEYTRMRVLAYLADSANRQPGSGVSLRSMEASLAISQGRARSACRALERDGLLLVKPRYDEDGGQRANVYVLTVKGRKALTDLLKRGAPCPE